MGSFWQDIRYGLRMLRRNPGVTALGIAALALGVGANTAMFSVADAFLLKPLPFPNLSRLVMVEQTLPEMSVFENSASPANFVEWRSQSHSFEKVAAYEWDDVNLTGDGMPQRAQAFLVTANFFDTLGVKPMMGRAFLPEEEEPGRDQEVVLSHGLWVRRYGADPNILGKTVKIDAKSSTVIGVMGHDFVFPLSAELWIPMAMDAAEKSKRKSHSVWVLGLRKPGVSLEQSAAEITTIHERTKQQYPDDEKRWGVRLVPLREAAAGDLTVQYTKLLMVAVGLVLLIACANVANLQLARAAGRQREIAVRGALGASRWRLIRQLLIESTLLSLVGAGLGLIFAEWSIDLILSNMPPDVARYILGWQNIRLDIRAFLYTLGIAVAAGVVSGLVPALQSTHPDLNEALKDGGRGGSGGRSRQRLRSIFVVAEVSISLVLLIGSGLLVKGFRSLINVNGNFEPESLLSMRLTLPDAKYRGQQPKIVSFYEQALEQIRTIPGVEMAATTTQLPYGDGGAMNFFSIENQPPQSGETRLARLQSISPNYFRVLHIPLREGREFSDADSSASAPVAVISLSMARRYFPNGSAVGQHIRTGGADSKVPWATIVGVVDEVRYDWISQGPQPTLYLPYRQSPFQYAYLGVRTSGNPESLISAVRSKIAVVDPDQPVYEVKSMDRMIHESVMGIAYVAVMMSVLGVIALLLASVGVYGVMAYAVTERTHEIGVRMALGAQRLDVLRMMASRGVLLTGIGLAIGLPVSFWLARLLARLLFGVSSADPAIFIGITALLSLIALAACVIPARRAMQVDPMVALRYE